MFGEDAREKKNTSRPDQANWETWRRQIWRHFVISSLQLKNERIFAFPIWDSHIVFFVNFGVSGRLI